ncbi:MAG: aryl-sulfate sulfotransferase [Micavibrio sp.]|nr:aryl-sulfate sulfotransferase [Micavibrio sp.]
MDLKTPPVKRSVTLHGHRTSITLEKPFWEELQKIAEAQSKSVNKIIAEIDEKRGANSLSSALRLYVLGIALSVS